MKSTTMSSTNVQRNRMMGYRHRQRGASLLEGIAYLGIAAIVILGAVSMVSSAFSSASSNSTTQELISLRTATRKLYMGQTYPTTANTIVTMLVSANAVPGTLNHTATTATNAWGGAVTLTGAAGGGSFTIVYNSVPKDVCLNIVSGASGWISISSTGGSTTNSPATATDATTVCNATSNNVTFTAT